MRTGSTRGSSQVDRSPSASLPRTSAIGPRRSASVYRRSASTRAATTRIDRSASQSSSSTDGAAATGRAKIVPRLARIAFGYQFQTVASLGPTLVNGFGLTYAGLGSLVGAYMLLGTFVALPLGLLGRRFGDRWVLGAGLLLMTAGACVSGWADSVNGIAAGMRNVG